MLKRIDDLVALRPETPWLDYGCGVGGLVRFLRSRGYTDAWGFEQGWSEARLREQGIPYLQSHELEAHAGTFEVVTATEVIEHSVDPLGDLARMRALLKPGGLLFLTTGNAEPFRDKLSTWQYVMPEIHISFFEPSTLARALESVGFDPQFPGFGPGWVELYRAKLLRTLGVKTTNAVERVLPWSVMARLLESKLHLAAQPVGLAAER